MKYLKKFEAVIVPDKIDNDKEITSFDELIEYGNQNDFDVVEYDEFYNSLGEKSQKEAPPRHAPFFALFHPVRKKAMFVVSDKNVVNRIPNFKNIVDDIIGHERIHSEQSKRKGEISYKLPSPLDKKSYFSNKDEIMAFAWTIANDLSKVTNSVESAFNKLNRGLGSQGGAIWYDIKKYCDDKTIKRYKKYIYLYLEKIFNKKSSYNINNKINRK